MNLTVAQGDFFGFIGPNGAGKSTTIRTLLGLIAPSQGSAQILGMDIRRQKEEILSRVGYMPSEASFYRNMRVGDVIKFSADMRRKDCRTKAQDLCERLELDVNKKIRELSLGNRKKVSIVCALQHTPELCILDEPTSGLDPLMQSRFIDLVGEEKKKGKTILMSSHMFEEVERTCDRIGIIRKGRMVAVDAADALRERHTRSYTVTLAGQASAEAFALDFGGRLSGLQVTVTARQSLEQIFMNYYGGEEHAEQGAV